MYWLQNHTPQQLEAYLEHMGNHFRNKFNDHLGGTPRNTTERLTWLWFQLSQSNQDRTLDWVKQNYEPFKNN